MRTFPHQTPRFLHVLLIFAFFVPAATATEPRPPLRVTAPQEPLPDGAVKRYGTTHLRASYTNDAAFSPDGQFLAVSSRDCVNIWRPKTGGLSY